MKVLHINTTDTGGSGISAQRLSKALNSLGVESKILVLDKNLNNDDTTIPYFNSSSTKLNKIKALIQRNLLASYYQWRIRGLNNSGEMFTFPKSLIDITKHPLYAESDIIHLHQTYDFIDIPTFFAKNNKPIVWTFHDMNPFNGGYHLINNDNNSPKLDKIAIKNIEIKKRAYDKIKNLKIICTSSIMLKYLNKSQLFSNSEKYVVPNGVNRNIFRNYDKIISRQVFELPLDKKIILFISDDHNRANKGRKFFEKIYEKYKNEYYFAIAGKNSYQFYKNYINTKLLGQIQDERLLPLLYSACDATIVPSEFESFSLVTLESIACSTPVVAFDNSGPSEIIKHKENGYLSKFKDFNDFCLGIEYLIKDNDFSSKRDFIYSSVAQFDINNVAMKYIELYKI